MKKILLLLLVSVFSVSVFAAEKKGVSKSTELSTSTAHSNSTYNLTVSPIGLLIGMISGTAEYKLNDSWTVGPDFLLWNLTIGSWKWSATGIGAKATWYSNGTYLDGWYASPSIDLLSVSSTYTSGSYTGSASASASALTLLGGYAWFWNSFNMNLGIGIGTGLGSSSITVTDSTGTRQTASIPTSTGLDFKMGFMF